MFKFFLFVVIIFKLRNGFFLCFANDDDDVVVKLKNF